MQILHDYSLLSYNTFHVDCKARYFVSIESAADFLELLHTPERKSSNKRLFLGGGSNMLLTGTVFEGIVVHNNIQGKEIVSDEPHEIFLKVGGGEDRNKFVERSTEQGMYGVENLISIPGNVAAAPIQNIGAYGMDVSHAVVQVGGINLNTGTYESVSHKDCHFGYRDSVFKHDFHDIFFITDVTFRLQHYDRDTYSPIVNYGNIQGALTEHGIRNPSPHDMAHIIAGIRAQKLPGPRKVGTAGSFFKNIILTDEEFTDFSERVRVLKPDLPIESFPVGDYHKVPTGWILDHVLGLRGYREGKVGCRESQALCLVNYGGATGHDILAFARKIQKECHLKLGISIEPEVNFIQ